MNQSNICESCTVYHSKSFFFDSCTIVLRLIRVESCYCSARFLLEVTRYCRGCYYFPSNVRVDDICRGYRMALQSYLFSVHFYDHFIELEHKKKLRDLFKDL